jgi:transposase
MNVIVDLAKIKTDKVDALVLAKLLRCDYLPRVWEPDAATQRLRRLTHRRASLVADRTAIKNRLHAVLAELDQARQWPLPRRKLESSEETNQVVQLDAKLVRLVVRFEPHLEEFLEEYVA